MVRVRGHKQREIIDPWGFLSPKRRQLLDHSWPGMFNIDFRVAFNRHNDIRFWYSVN